MKNNFKLCRRLAASILKCGQKKIRFLYVDKEMQNEINSVSTKEHVRELIKKRNIFVLKKTSKKKKKIFLKKSGTKKIRSESREKKIKKLRLLRTILKKHKLILKLEDYWSIYEKIKLNKIKNKSRLYKILNETVKDK